MVAVVQNFFYFESCGTFSFMFSGFGGIFVPTSISFNSISNGFIFLTYKLYADPYITYMFVSTVLLVIIINIQIEELLISTKITS